MYTCPEGNKYKLSKLNGWSTPISGHPKYNVCTVTDSYEAATIIINSENRMSVTTCTVHNEVNQTSLLHHQNPKWLGYFYRTFGTRYSAVYLGNKKKYYTVWSGLRPSLKSVPSQYPIWPSEGGCSLEFRYWDFDKKLFIAFKIPLFVIRMKKKILCWNN